MIHEPKKCTEKKTKCFAELVRDTRKEMGTQQQELARACGLSPNHLAMMERNESGKYPARRALALICCNLSLNYYETLETLKKERREIYAKRLDDDYDLQEETLDKILASADIITKVLNDLV